MKAGQSVSNKDSIQAMRVKPNTNTHHVNV